MDPTPGKQEHHRAVLCFLRGVSDYQKRFTYLTV